MDSKVIEFKQDGAVGSSKLFLKRFEIYSAKPCPALEMSSIIEEVKPTRTSTQGHLWRVSFPFDLWVWEAPARAFDLPGTAQQNWRKDFPEFPADAVLQQVWDLALAPRNGKKATEALAESEAALSGWLLPSMDSERRRDAWRARVEVGEDAFVFASSQGVFTSTQLPSRPFIWFLLQRLHLDAIDKRLKEISQATSGKLDRLFKITPRHLLKQNELAEYCAEISSMRLRFDAIVEPVFSPRKFFPCRSDQKFYRMLVDELDLEDEVEALSDRLETLEDIYSTMGDRLTEYRYFLSEMVMEALIVFILLWEIYVIYQNYEP